jgi:two-component system, chemotaxis family, sensor kinase CheA
LFFNRLRVRGKLMLLAGVPVLGTLLLSLFVVLDVQQRARAAAGVGSIENLAHLTGKMLHLIHDLQWERAEVTYAAGGGKGRPGALEARYAETDGALADLSDFLNGHDALKLPPTLSENLDAAKEQLLRLKDVRASSLQSDFVLLDYIDYVAKVNDSLIGATAALTQLSTDKELMLSIGGLVSAMQVIERNAREHALLNYVFGKQEFPPGTFRYLVTLVTEQQVYLDAVRVWSSAEEFAQLETALRGPSKGRIAAMRRTALETTDEVINVDPKAWFDAQAESQRAFGATEQAMVDTVRAVAAAKVAETDSAVRIAIGLVASVTGVSLLLGWAITRTLTRGVRELSVVAEAVYEKNDYTIRAVKTSSDELGLLTDTFNGMLVGIQRRDRELEAHRQNLEALVDERTRELSERNLEMRLVLDNIDQGLAMIDARGNFLGECSKTFVERFGQPSPHTPFYSHPALNEGDASKSLALELGFDQLIADILPLEVALAQLPSHVVHDGRHYALSFTRIVHGGVPTGALLVTRDVTEELLAARAKLEQNERVQVFERIMRDRTGFTEFLEEAGRLARRIATDACADRVEKMRSLHTLKGLTAVFDVPSVSEAAHELEQALAGDDAVRIAAAHRELVASWEKFLGVVGPVLGRTQRQRVELSFGELREIVARVRSGAPHAEILRALIELGDEPIELRFERMQDQLTRVARYLRKPEPVVHVRAGHVRLPVERFREFWMSLAHLVRNIVDHGLEPEPERAQQGKPPKNHVELSAHTHEHGVCIEVSDDGRGILWDRLAEKARQRGLPCSTRAELVRALFADGVSTAETVTQTSGRGVGMAAVEAACRALGGSISVESEPGHGTRFRFEFPRRDDAEVEAGWCEATGPRSRPSEGPERGFGWELGRSRPPAAIA